MPGVAPNVTVAPGRKLNPVRETDVPPAALPSPGNDDSTMRWENSEVLLSGEVAVAVTTAPGSIVTGRSTSITPLPLASVVTSAAPR